DVVIQNAANSGCGQAAIQIAAARGIKTINIVRQRSDFDDVCQHLKDLGATEVISDFSAQKGDIKQLHGGTMVTYGGMSRQPITLPTGLLIFNDIKVVGYWMSRWHDKNGKSEEAQAMISELCDWSKKGKLKLPRHRMVPLMDYKSAIETTIGPYSTEKQILSMESL
uniref:Trans-2-enoyl-CoA reductase, mitochondrial-like n=1 Tax=Saccoglossus kowalevskii TaxID=10224 RepID=A0ABM0M033_SACKO